MQKALKKKTYFLVRYRDPKEGQILELKAHKIEDSTLGLSFIKISDFIFDTDHLVVKPSEEQLQKRFENVMSLHLSIYSIISIEEMGGGVGRLKFRHDRSNLVAFPRDI